MVEERAGRVELTIGEGCCSFEPAEAMRLGNGIIDAATLALRHVSAVRK